MELTINHTDMCAFAEHYLNTVMLKEAVKVTAVERKTGTNHISSQEFTITYHKVTPEEKGS